MAVSSLGGLVVGLLAGALAGALGMLLGLRLRRGRARGRPADVVPAPEPLDSAVLERVPIAVIALDRGENVLMSNRRARELGLVGRRGLVEPLLDIARAARQRGETVSREASLPSVGLRRPAMDVRVQAVPLPDRVVALLVEDVTEVRRVDAVRRDFVANVSHEIKTPVGALALLAEAALESLAEGAPEETSGPADRGDVERARHFLYRIRHESARLGRLVTELIDLSRLQGAEARPNPLPVRLDAVVAEAIDRSALPADAREISIVRGDPTGAIVLGSESQLVTAVANLIDNAIAYSPDRTRVAVAVRRVADAWELTVTDQGVGIPEGDLSRIFERFYRVDPARSRETGGTGLGLAIVKHVIANHGGEVRVWSSLGAGSTFTLRLPVAPGSDTDPAGPAPSKPGESPVPPSWPTSASEVAR
jgi:two-component system sensor histidine kinase SenX3